MREVAVVKTTDQYLGCDGDWSLIAKHVSEWVEVTDEEFYILKQQQSYKSFILIEKVVNQLEFINSTVQEILEQARLEQERKEANRAADRARKQASKEKREAKSAAKKVELLKQLQAEVGHLVDQENDNT